MVRAVRMAEVDLDAHESGGLVLNFVTGEGHVSLFERVVDWCELVEHDAVSRAEVADRGSLDTSDDEGFVGLDVDRHIVRIDTGESAEHAA